MPDAFATSLSTTHRRWFALLLIVLVAVTYFPVARAGFIWDDESYVENNVHLRSIEGLRIIWTHIGATKQYYPLVFTTFWVEQKIYGLHPAGYHVVNVVLHAIASLLLVRVLRRLGLPRFVPELAGLLFALHPVHVESVAWVTERKNVLSLCFYLSAALAYWRFDSSLVEPEHAASEGTKPERDWRWYAASLGFFQLALLSKTVTSTLPASLLLLAWCVRGRLDKRTILPTLPMFVMGAVFGSITSYCEKTFVGATGPEFAFSPVDRVLIAGRAICFYAWKLLCPGELIFNYPRWTIDASLPWQYVFPLLVIAVIVTLWLMRSRLGRWPLTAALFYCGTLTPALGFFNVWPMRYSFVADHFQYHASVGLLALLAAGLVLGVRHGGAVLQRFGPALLVVIVLALGVRSWAHTHEFHDRFVLYQSTLAKNPDAWMPHGNLAALYIDTGRPADAIEHLQAAMRIKGDLPEFRMNLGMAFFRTNHWEQAIEHLSRRVEMPKVPAVAREMLGESLVRTGEVDRGIEQWQLVWGDESSFASQLRIGLALAVLGKPADALSRLERAVKLDPSSHAAHAALGKVLYRLQRNDAALEQLREAVRLGSMDPAVMRLIGELSGAAEKP